MPDTRTLLVIGGASGIGAAICHRGQLDGWRVISLDLTEHNNGSWYHGQVDLRNPESLSGAIDEIRARCGTVDALHITAGITDPTSILEISAERVNELFSINVIGVIEATRGFFPLLTDNGSIVLFSSIAAQRGGGFFGASAYAATKSAIESLTRGFAKEFSDRKIRVNCIAPGPTNTPMLMTATPEILEKVTNSTLLGRICEPEEIAEVALFLSGPKSSYITGATIYVDGGASIK
jgi:NAD(P)-dependent dehydrogenase (short-subunit alcohol dehydrogenase family)